VTNHLATMISAAMRAGAIDPMTMLHLETQRALLVDYIGMCERIIRTPIPFVYAVKVRRFILIFLALLPVAAVGRAGWGMPAVMGVVAYSILAMDQIGVELQNPFDQKQLSHLPLAEICATIERDVLWVGSLPPATAVTEPISPAPTPPG